jgi:hypothetical protein
MSIDERLRTGANAIRRRVAILLLRLYPAAWRAEYGAELEDLLSRRPLTLSAAVDTARHALWQRARVTELPTLIGLAMMLLIAGQLIWSQAHSPADLSAVLRRSSMTLPTVIVGLLWSDGYALLLMACGWWAETVRRRSDSAVVPRSGGMAAMRITVLAGLPVMLVGVLMMFGLLRGGQPAWMAPWAVFAAPLLRLPQAWVYGVVGQHIARFVADRRGRDRTLAQE